eukprot:CAMPEP_0175153206 /NCGR_PEP_ID=MMETSP0087-20121206/19592_1 /TAXON_ID=136419 /ORGANISM="Unknown Unknown, Strain D1" /LENGTH=259 /DNA_ID=CAMNT_0016439827 /DNA_START=286 /DNA_END=1065 /DNA_ORIENTATION=+
MPCIGTDTGTNRPSSSASPGWLHSAHSLPSRTRRGVTKCALAPAPAPALSSSSSPPATPLLICATGGSTRCPSPSNRPPLCRGRVGVCRDGTNIFFSSSSSSIDKGEDEDSPRPAAAAAASPSVVGSAVPWAAATAAHLSAVACPVPVVPLSPSVPAVCSISSVPPSSSLPSSPPPCSFLVLLTSGSPPPSHPPPSAAPPASAPAMPTSRAHTCPSRPINPTDGASASCTSHTPVPPSPPPGAATGLACALQPNEPKKV